MQRPKQQNEIHSDKASKEKMIKRSRSISFRFEILVFNKCHRIIIVERSGALEWANSCCNPSLHKLYARHTNSCICVSVQPLIIHHISTRELSASGIFCCCCKCVHVHVYVGLGSHYIALKINKASEIIKEAHTISLTVFECSNGSFCPARVCVCVIFISFN